MNNACETKEAIVEKDRSLKFLSKKIQALNEQRIIPRKLIVGKTNEAVIVIHGKKPNESKSWSRDGVSVIGERDELIRLRLNISISISLEKT